jgi:hypothetical protein
VEITSPEGLLCPDTELFGLTGGISVKVPMRAINGFEVVPFALNPGLKITVYGSCTVLVVVSAVLKMV